MRALSFWSSLEPGRRFLYGLFSLLALGALALGLYGYLYGSDALFPLVKLADLYPVEVALFPSTSLLTHLSVKSNAYLVTEQYGLGDMQIPAWGVSGYFAVLALALAFYWALISTFRRLPYFAGVTLGMLWLVTLNLDLIGIFSETGRTLLLIALAALGSLSYFFHSFWHKASLFQRFLAFAGMVGLLMAGLLYFSPLPAFHTVFHVVQYGAAGGFIASLLFMVLVAYENLHGLLWFNTQAQNPKRRFGLVQFLAISVLYLGNLLLLYLQFIGTVSADYAGIDALVLFVASALIGAWGLRQRQAQYGRFFLFETDALPLYLVLASLTFLTLAYACLMANDPMVQAYRGAVIMTHLAFGATFLLYLMVNFGPLIRQKLKVYKVVYDPRKLPYFIVYLAGSVVVLVLFFRAQFSVYYLSQAGHYNYLGDLYRLTEEKPLLAEQFYRESQVMARRNQRAHLSLADMYRQGNMRRLEMQQLRDLLEKKPSPEAYLRLANLYTSSSDLFDHIKLLQEGVKKYPDYAPLLNNLGLLYNTTTFKDSAAFYLDAALLKSTEPAVVQANQLAFLARHQFHEQALSFSEKYGTTQYGPLQTNRLAIALSQGKTDSTLSSGNIPYTDSLLTTQTFAYYYLQRLASPAAPDSAGRAYLDKLLRQEENQVFAQDLTILKAFQLQQGGQPTQARQTLEFLAANSPRTAGYYYDVLGQWMLQGQLYPLAANYFNRAVDAGYKEATLHAALALALAGEPEQAAQKALQAANAAASPGQKAAATRLALATQLSPDQAAAAPDSLKVQFLQIQAAALPLSVVENVAQKITTPALAPHAALPIIERYLQEKEFTKAGQMLQAHFPTTFPKNSLKSKANALAAELFWLAGNYQALEKNLGALYFAPIDAGVPHYYRALLAQRNKKTALATNHFNTLVRIAPWFETGQLTAANFFIQQQKPLRAYDLLLEAMAYNPRSAALRKAYVRVALSQGLQNYALQALEQLAPLVSAQEYASFKNEIDAQLQKSKNLQEEW